MGKRRNLVEFVITNQFGNDCCFTIKLRIINIPKYKCKRFADNAFIFIYFLYLF